MMFRAGDKVATGHTLRRRLHKSPHESFEVNDTDKRAWEYEGGGWDFEQTFIRYAAWYAAERKKNELL